VNIFKKPVRREHEEPVDPAKGSKAKTLKANFAKIKAPEKFRNAAKLCELMPRRLAFETIRQVPCNGQKHPFSALTID